MTSVQLQEIMAEDQLVAEIHQLGITYLSNRVTELPERASFYLLGGGALCLLGSPRQTMDIDYTTDLDSD